MSIDVSAGLIGDLLSEEDVPRNIKFQKIAFFSKAGEMKKLSFIVGFPELAEQFSFDRLLSRHDFDVEDDSTPGQRDINDTHVKHILEGIRHSKRPHIGTLTVALGEEYVEIQEIRTMTKDASLVRFTVYEGAPNPVATDGQHRITVASRLWPEVRYAADGEDGMLRRVLEESSVEVTLLLEDKKDILSTLFVQMGSTKPISPSLIAVMDTSMLQNRLGQYFMKKAKLLEDRVGYLSTSASRQMAEDKGKTFDGIYAAAAVRSAASSMAGVGFRDRSPDLRERLLVAIVEDRAKKNQTTSAIALEQLGKDLVATLDYAADTIPGWKHLTRGVIDAATFKRDYVHSAAAGLHVIANVICAGRIADVDPHELVDALADIPWRRDALRDGKDGEGNFAKVHEMFEGDLVMTRFEPSKGQWIAGPGGATRSTYEPATEKLLREIARRRPALRKIAELSTLQELGLVARAGRGRPRKSVG